VKLFAGIDGGQSSTIALVADERRRVLGRGISGACDYIGQSADSVRFARALESAVAAALRAADLPADSEFAAVVAGISGYEGKIVGVEPHLKSSRVHYLHDAKIAHAACFGDGPGIIVIAGTGSVALGRNERGEEATVGGWGFLFGDEGSAFATARAALAHAMQAQDAGLDTTLARRATQFFERPDLRTIAHDFYVNRIERSKVASFATVVFELSDGGDEAATGIVRDAARSLADLAATCAQRLQLTGAGTAVSLAGGTFASESFLGLVSSNIRERMPRAKVAKAADEPVTGALLLAYKEAAE